MNTPYSTTFTNTDNFPGYIAGVWRIDPDHSEVGFIVRHMMVTKVHGRFRDVDAQITTAPRPDDSVVTATITMASIDTGNERRDAHLRSSDFFDVDQFPTMTYRSTGLTNNDGVVTLNGELTLKGVTRPVPLTLEMNGFAHGPNGETVSGFSATGQLNRRDFGVTFDAPLPGGGAGIADKIDIQLEIEATLVR